MNKLKFTEALKEFRGNSEGAACFFDPVREVSFCGNRLTRKQAEDFAEKNDLVLKSWKPGKSCSEVNCG